MSSVAQTLGTSYSAHPLRRAFLKWQCHIRQLAMREQNGRPTEAIMPAITLPGADEPLGHVITLINKAPAYSVTAELQHMFRKTHDPAQRRENAIKFLSATYYQKATEFSDILTASFAANSQGAAQIIDAGNVLVTFDAYAQSFELQCKVWKLEPHNPLYQATIAHNALFNAEMLPDPIILGFEPDWDGSTSDPAYR